MGRGLGREWFSLVQDAQASRASETASGQRGQEHAGAWERENWLGIQCHRQTCLQV